MTPAEKLTALKILAALAWADGKLTGQEIESLVNFISQIGPWQGSEIKDVLRNQTELSEQALSELAGLTPPSVAHLLSTANQMSNAERPATEKEQEIVRRAAHAALGKERWKEVETWLAAERGAQHLRRTLFGSA